MARNLYDQLRGGSLRALGYQDGGDVTDGQPGGATGQWNPSQPSILDRIANAAMSPGSPVAETLKTLTGAKQAVSAAQGTGSTVLDAYGNWVDRSGNQVAQGWQQATQPGASWEQRRLGASNVIRGMEPFALPALPGELALTSAPGALLATEAGGLGAAYGTEKLGQKLGWSPGWSQLASDVVGLAGGDIGQHFAGMAKGGPVLKGMRQKTLDALRYADGGVLHDADLTDDAGTKTISINPDVVEQSWQPGVVNRQQPQIPARKQPITVDPDQLTWRPPAPAPQAQGLASLDLRPAKTRPLVTPYDPKQMDVALGKAAELGTQVALPMGLAALGGPEALWAVRALGPALTQSLLGPVSHNVPGVLMGALPSESAPLEGAPLRTNITPEEVLQAAAAGPGKFGGFASYIERNPTAGEQLFDISNPQPSLPDRPAIPRYDPSLGRGRGPSARVVDAFNNPKVIEGLKYYVNEGAKKLPEDWYANDPLYRVYQQEWGPQAEEKFFQQMGYQAATSTGSAVPDNLRTGSLYNYMAEQGIPFPAKPPQGYGSKYQVAHRDTALNLLNTGTVDPIANPKRASFTENLMGNEDWLTADKHFMRLVGILSEDPRFLKTTAEVSRGGQLVNIKPQELFQQGKLTMADAVKDPNLWVEAPNPNEYLYLENQFRNKVAKPLGHTVANAQGKAWVGAGDVTGLGSPPASWINLLRQRVQYTADRLNVDPQVILQKFVRGEIPLLQVIPGAIGLGAAGSMHPEEGQAWDTDRTRTAGRPAMQ